jgi:hypothetical protein
MQEFVGVATMLRMALQDLAPHDSGALYTIDQRLTKLPRHPFGLPLHGVETAEQKVHYFGPLFSDLAATDSMFVLLRNVIWSQNERNTPAELRIIRATQTHATVTTREVVEVFFEIIQGPHSYIWWRKDGFVSGMLQDKLYRVFQLMELIMGVKCYTMPVSSVEETRKATDFILEHCDAQTARG